MARTRPKQPLARHGMIDVTDEGVIARSTYTQTATPNADPSGLTLGTQFMALWNVDVDYPGTVGPIVQGGGNAFGPRGSFQVEGMIRYGYNMTFTVIPPVGFNNQPMIRSQDGVARTISGGFGYIANAYYFADNAACVMLKNDTTDGPTGFVANDLVSGTGTGSWDGLTNNIAITGFATALNVVNNSDLRYAIGYKHGPTNVDGTASVYEEQAIQIPRLINANVTRQIGVKCDSPIELWTDIHTHTVAPPIPAVIVGPGIHVLDYANAAFPSPVYVKPMLILKQAGNPFGSLVGAIRSEPTVKNDTTFTGDLGPVHDFWAAPNIQGDTHATTIGSHNAFTAAGNFSTLNSGTLHLTNNYGFYSQPVFGAGVTVDNATGLRVDDATGTGTKTLLVGVDLYLSSGTTNLSLRSSTAAQMRHQGSAIFGSGGVATAPAARLDVFEPTLGNEVMRLRTTSTNDDPTVSTYQNRVTTTDATATVIHNVPITASMTYEITAYVVGRRTGGSAGTADDGISNAVSAAFKTASGTVTQIQSTTTLYIHESTIYPGATFAVNGASVDVKVAGLANTNMTWHATVQVRAVGT